MRNTVLGGRYRILERIGEGGMAFVYVALDEKLGRKVAIKVLHEHMEKNADIRKRFQLEAQAVSGLDHPNIVKIYDFSGNSSERLWIVTEVINGKNIAEFVSQTTGGWLHPIISACLVREICKALEKAHSQGIVHRDIKPENIMITQSGLVKLMDFGIAKDMGKSRMTLTGTFMGSPSYMSPEQIRGRDVDHRSDLYSLSILFYEIVTGRLPFTGQTTHDVVMRIMEGNFTHPRFIVPEIPQTIDNLIVRGMSKDKEIRFQNAREYGVTLEKIIENLGFHESHIELERYFKDRKKYEAKLAKRNLGDLTQAGVTEKFLQQRHAKTTDQPSAPRTHKVDRQEPSRISRRLDSKSVYEQHRPTVPPFKKDTWQKHIPETRSKTGVHQNPTPPPPPRQSVVQPPAPASAISIRQNQLPMSGGRHVQRPVKKRVPKVRRHQQRRNPRRMAASYNQQPNFLSFALGILLVGFIGGVAIWGFWEFQQRLDQRKVVKVQKSTQQKKINKKRKKRIVKKRKPSSTRKYSSNYKRKSTASKYKKLKTNSPRKKKTYRTIVKPSRVEKTKNPKVHVETVEVVKKTMPREKSDKSDPESDEDEEVAVEEPEEQKPEIDPSTPGQVRISSQPAAEVYVDGKRMGTTNDKITSSEWISLSGGSHRIELKREGYAMHRVNFSLKPGEKKIFNSIALEQNAGLDRTYRLTLRTTLMPVQVTIRNLDNNSTQAFTMNQKSQVVELENGRFQVKMEKNGQVKERFITLNANQSKLTFSANFKEE
jgi:serine/threonine protein kinase